LQSRRPGKKIAAPPKLTMNMKSTGKSRSRWRLCCIIPLLLWHGTPALAENDSTESAIRFLSQTEAMVYPTEGGCLQGDEATRQLFYQQMSALRQLTGRHDLSLVPVLIPYIYYTDDPSFEDGITHDPRPPRHDVKWWIFHYPAFETIVMTPGSGPILAKYALDTNNPGGYRMHAFDALKTMYPGVSTVAVPSPEERALLERIENGEVKPFPRASPTEK
jgi:hypothetical protein